MFAIGCHLSTTKGYLAMGKQAQAIGANTFQFFTRNPRGGQAAAISTSDAQALTEYMQENKFAPILAHAPYTINPCSVTPKTRKFSHTIMADDLERLEKLPCHLYVFHPGSHTGQGVETGISLIAECLNNTITPDQKTIVLLETMTGKGSEVGGTFEELAAIINAVEHKEKIGVCFDTCHVHDAGYDIANNLEAVLKEFDSLIGLEKIYAIHINDSKNEKGSKKDRHEQLGKGAIGLETLTALINYPAFVNTPFLLETPHELGGYATEIALLTENYGVK